MKKLFVLILAVTTAHLTFAQFEKEEKAPDYSDLKVVPIQGYLNDSLNFQPYDSSLYRFFYHFPYLYTPQVVAGHYGAPITPTFHQLISPIYFSGISSWNAYSMAENGANTYRVIQPFTTVTYHNGPQQEQGVGFNHTQNINPNTNVGIFYDNFVANSYYIRSRSRQVRFRAYGGIKSKNGRHQVAGDFAYYKIEKEENGGLIDTLNTNILDSISNKAAIPAFLSDADHLNRYNVARLYHRTLLGKEDTNGVVSTKAPVIFSQYAYRKHRSVYSDNEPNSDFYQRFNIGATNAIYDSLSYQQFTGRIGLRQNIKNFRVAAAFLVIQEHYDEGVYEHNNFETGFTGSASWANASGWAFRDTISLIANGRNAGGGYHQFLAQVPIGARYNFVGELKNIRRKPDYMFESFSVDTLFSWQGASKMSLQQSLGASIQRRGNSHYQLGFKYSILENMPYYNELSYPVQSSRALQLLQANVRALFKAGDYYLDLQANYQVSNDEDILRLPNWWIYASLYLDKPVFKNAITTRIGFDFQYNSAYEALGFNPTTRNFYNQQGRVLGEYPWLDAYLMVRIGRARIYTKFTNLLQGVVEENYAYVPNYPMEPRSFRIAFRWDFWN